MLLNQHLGILAAKSEEDFRIELAKFASRLGFRCADSLTVFDRGPTQTEFTYVSSDECPEWKSIDPSYGQRDPVMQHCRSSSIPIVWGERTYTAQGLGDLHDVLASQGMKSGISMCSHLTGGRHLAITVNTDRDTPSDPRRIADVLSKMQLFSVYALDAACRLFLPAASHQIDQFTRQELDALSWILEGRSSFEIARQLNLSEETLQALLGRVASDLGCADERQAALMALRLGFIG